MNVISSVYTDTGFVFLEAENNKRLEMVRAPAFFFLPPTESIESQNIDVALHQKVGQHIPVSNIITE